MNEADRANKSIRSMKRIAKGILPTAVFAVGVLADH